VQVLLLLSHPDYTVGSGISPDLLTPLYETVGARGLVWFAVLRLFRHTAGQEFHPALSTSYQAATTTAATII